MRNDIFQQRERHLAEGGELSMLLSGLTVLLAILIAANFDRITARIAIGIVNILTSGIPILAVVILLGICLMRFTWNMRRRFWGW